LRESGPATALRAVVIQKRIRSTPLGNLTRLMRFWVRRKSTEQYPSQFLRVDKLSQCETPKCHNRRWGHRTGLYYLLNSLSHIAPQLLLLNPMDHTKLIVCHL
jgi:hypothetical protein